MMQNLASLSIVKYHIFNVTQYCVIWYHNNIVSYDIITIVSYDIITILCHMRSYDTILYEIIWNGHIFRIIRHRHLAKHYLSKRSLSSSPKSSFASSLSLLPGRERPFQEVHSSSSQLHLQAVALPPFFYSYHHFIFYRFCPISE